MRNWIRNVSLALVLVAGGGSIYHRYPALMQSRPIHVTSSAVLTWATSQVVVTYNVKRSLVSGGPYTILASGITATTYTDSTVAPKTTYYYVVSATNSVGESLNSTESVVSIP